MFQARPFYICCSAPNWISLPTTRRTPLSRFQKFRSSKTVSCSESGSKRQASVSVPTTPVVPRPPPVRPLSWAFTASLLTISIAAFSLANNLFRASKSVVSEASAPPADALTSTEEALVANVAPLVLAAETAAAADETASLSSQDLEKLELNLRMLITNMDSQLSEMEESLAALLPQDAAAGLDAALRDLAAAEDALAEAPQDSEAAEAAEARVTELRWEVHGVLAAHAAEDSRRRHRALLYNRGVQAQLLRQVERQAMLRSKMREVEAQLQAAVHPEGPSCETSSSAAADNTNITPTSAVPAQVSQLRRLAVAGHVVPHPRKAHSGGEDAFFVNAESGAFGVADGVGGWASAGVDPAEYPRKLMAACEESVARHGDPIDVLSAAHQVAHAPGSCTVAVAALDGGFLRLASLGDCGTRVVRAGQVVFASEVQEHRFNQPFQMGSPQYYGGNVPEDAHQYRVAVQQGDVIVMGSDGLWDNLWDHELEALVEEEMGTAAAAAAGEENTDIVKGDSGFQQARATELAQRLAALAATHATDRFFRSPFSVEKARLSELEAPSQSTFGGVLQGVRQLVGMAGGKVDDVTAVVAIVL